MSKSVPIAITQIVESILDPKTPAHVKANQAQVLMNVQEYCGAALKKYHNARPFN